MDGAIATATAIAIASAVVYHLECAKATFLIDVAVPLALLAVLEQTRDGEEEDGVQTWVGELASWLGRWKP